MSVKTSDYQSPAEAGLLKDFLLTCKLVTHCLSFLSENGGPALGGSLELGTNIRANGKECLALTIFCFCMAAPVIIRCRGASTSWQ